MGLLEQIKGLQEQLSLVIDASQQIADESFAAGNLAGISSRDEEVAALKSKITELESGILGGKIYSQVELDAAILTAIAPLQSQVGALTAEMELLKASVAASMDDSYKNGQKDMKASIKAEYLAQQVAETAGETGFSALLD